MRENLSSVLLTRFIKRHLDKISAKRTSVMCTDIIFNQVVIISYQLLSERPRFRCHIIIWVVHLLPTHCKNQVFSYHSRKTLQNTSCECSEGSENRRQIKDPFLSKLVLCSTESTLHRFVEKNAAIL